MPTVLLLYPHFQGSPSTLDDEDCLVQMEAVGHALEELGFSTKRLTFSVLNYSVVAKVLQEEKFDLVFNLVEEIRGEKALNYLAPSLLEHLGTPFTGCSAEACLITTNKLFTKLALTGAGLPTPEWIEPETSDEQLGQEGPLYLLKPIDADASQGLQEDKLQLLTARGARNKLKTIGRSWFAERFIDGREFNISLLDTVSGPTPLPPAEIIFSDYGTTPKVVGYKAKWDPTSFEYTHTIRSFQFSSSDTALLDEVTDLALQCWRLFKLSGYARVDFRIDSNNKPWILEINANPGIAPDSGLAAAAAKAGLTYADLIHEITLAGQRNCYGINGKGDNRLP